MIGNLLILVDSFSKGTPTACMRYGRPLCSALNLSSCWNYSIVAAAFTGKCLRECTPSWHTECDLCCAHGHFATLDMESRDPGMHSRASAKASLTLATVSKHSTFDTQHGISSALCEQSFRSRESNRTVKANTMVLS